MKTFLSLSIVALLARATSLEVVIGPLRSATSTTLRVAGPTGLVTLTRDSNSKIWRGRIYPDFSVLQPGDDISARCRRDPDGQLVVTELWANIDHITGRIDQVWPGGFLVDQNFDADSRSAYRRQSRQIAYTADTTFEISAPEDLLAGRTVDIIGLKTNPTGAEATRIIIYDGHSPVRMDPGNRVTFPASATKPCIMD